MTIKEIKDKGIYLFSCKENHLNAIRPADTNSKNLEGYKKLVAVAKTYFENNQLDNFADYFQEYQYAVNLWTAHLIIEYGQPDNRLLNRCLEIIESYSDTPLDETLAKEEKKWLDNFKANKKVL